jgi:CHAD domain-containing protein
MARSTTISAATEGSSTAARRNALPGRLSPGTACDTAFRIIASRHLRALLAQHDGTCRGDPDALHQIRIALTHLRTAIRFFSPMVDDAVRPQIWAELKWLNRQLGMVRDLDVAIERVVAESGDELAVVAELRQWDDKRAESHRLLTRALRSARYRRLIEQTSAWIERGPWSTRRNRDAISLRRRPLSDHAAARLADWEKTLLRKSRKLARLDVEKRHKLRLLNKRLTYAMESLQEIFVGKSLAKQTSVLKLLRRAQRSLGQLNDDARGETLARSLDGAGPKAAARFADRKREKRLLKTALAAYGRLGRIKPFRAREFVAGPDTDDQP